MREGEKRLCIEEIVFPVEVRKGTQWKWKIKLGKRLMYECMLISLEMKKRIM